MKFGFGNSMTSSKGRLTADSSWQTFRSGFNTSLTNPSDNTDTRLAHKQAAHFNLKNGQRMCNDDDSLEPNLNLDYTNTTWNWVSMWMRNHDTYASIGSKTAHAGVLWNLKDPNVFGGGTDQYISFTLASAGSLTSKPQVTVSSRDAGADSDFLSLYPTWWEDSGGTMTSSEIDEEWNLFVVCWQMGDATPDDDGRLRIIHMRPNMTTGTKDVLITQVSDVGWDTDQENFSVFNNFDEWDQYNSLVPNMNAVSIGGSAAANNSADNTWWDGGLGLITVEYNHYPGLEWNNFVWRQFPNDSSSGPTDAQLKLLWQEGPSEKSNYFSNNIKVNISAASPARPDPRGPYDSKDNFISAYDDPTSGTWLAKQDRFTYADQSLGYGSLSSWSYDKNGIYTGT